MPKDAYPVLNEISLARPTRRAFRGSHRELAELPEQHPGTVLVFEVNGSYRALTRRRLTGREPIVVDALSVSIVNTRPTIVPVYLRVPSASPADDFVIQTGFRCQVHSPEIVAEHGLRDIAEILQKHLARDSALLAKCAARNTKDIGNLRIEAKAEIQAYCKVRPPSVVGITIELDSVEVLTPRGEVEQAKKLLQTEREQAIDRLRRMGENEAVDYLKKMLETSVAARALAVSRGELSSDQAAQQVADLESGHLNGMIDLIKVMAQSDRMDRVPLDIQRLYDSAMKALTGDPHLTSSASLPSADTTDSPPPRLGGQDDDDRFVPDEDYLTGGEVG